MCHIILHAESSPSYIWSTSLYFIIEQLSKSHSTDINDKKYSDSILLSNYISHLLTTAISKYKDTAITILGRPITSAPWCMGVIYNAWGWTRITRTVSNTHQCNIKKQHNCSFFTPWVFFEALLRLNTVLSRGKQLNKQIIII